MDTIRPRSPDTIELEQEDLRARCVVLQEIVDWARGQTGGEAPLSRAALRYLIRTTSHELAGRQAEMQRNAWELGRRGVA